MKRIAQNLFYGTSMLIAFLFPIEQMVLPFLIAILFVSWLLKGEFGDYTEKRKPVKWIIFSFLLFYVLHVAGLIYSENMELALFNLEVKLSFLILPLIFLTSRPFSTTQIYNLLLAFIGGSLIACMASFGFSFYNYLESFSTHWFYSSYLSVFMHPGYFSVYLLFAIVSAIYILYSFTNSRSLKYGLLLSIGVFYITIILLASKTIIFLLFILSFAFGIWLILRHRRYITGAVGLVLFVLIFALGLSSTSITSYRFSLAMEKLLSGEFDKNKKESTTIRVLAWKTALDVIREKALWGSGTGDFRDDMMRNFEANGYMAALERRTNAHNQYLQTFGSLGLAGFFTLLFMVFYSLVFAWINRKFLLMAFSLLMALTALTESIFEVQAGVVFFNFFMMIFLTREDGFERKTATDVTGNE